MDILLSKSSNQSQYLASIEKWDSTHIYDWVFYFEVETKRDKHIQFW